ncbi:MAG: ArsR/SmtB family transcription factor [Paraglaciecola chathamensis]
MNLEEMRDNAQEAATLLKAMANQHRLLLLCLLSRGEMSVSELNEQVTIAQSSLSQHLAGLRRENLVVTRREAQTIYYSLASKEVKAIIDTLYTLYCSAQD